MHFLINKDSAGTPNNNNIKVIIHYIFINIIPKIEYYKLIYKQYGN